jgi:hypothetical protein
MTNQHCARNCISQLADAKHDYIANGFNAAKLEDEKQCPALEANQLVEITDVTSQMNAATGGKSERAFHEAERAEKARIERTCGTAQDVRCEVVTLYHGGVYDLYKYKRYQDIRLVFAPEESVASFGGDPDNFSYPRYDLDATLLRIYEHDKPLASPHFLKFATHKVHAGDIAIASGNPGSTERESTLAQLQFLRDDDQPFLLNLLSEFRGLLNQYATQGAEYDRTSEAFRASVENTVKLDKGRQLALVHSSIMQAKARTESQYLNFVPTYDVAGGNSGSPVIGRHGEVIGLHFDSTFQSLGKYFGFDPSVNRGIAVDVTGITEALRNIYHADRLIGELTQP